VKLRVGRVILKSGIDKLKGYEKLYIGFTIDTFCPSDDVFTPMIGVELKVVMLNPGNVTF